MRKSRTKIDYLLVDRLCALYDPFKAIGVNREADFESWAVVSHFGLDSSFQKSTRTRAYHYGRIRYFKLLLLQETKIDPIVVDNYCFDSHILPQLVLLDGNHRLAAAFLAGVKKVPASYGGRTDLLSYLKGRRKTPPLE
jgi:hypothetical protein